MTDDRVNEEFNELVKRVQGLAEVEVTEIAEPGFVVEIAVPIDKYPEPEDTLLQVLREYLQSGPRRAILGISVTYEARGGNPTLVAAVILTSPL
jgi:hypothetical protein